MPCTLQEGQEGHPDLTDILSKCGLDVPISAFPSQNTHDINIIHHTDKVIFSIFPNINKIV